MLSLGRWADLARIEAAVQTPGHCTKDLGRGRRPESLQFQLLHRGNWGTSLIRFSQVQKLWIHRVNACAGHAGERGWMKMLEWQ
jgi:hypothetical protein